MAFGANMTTLTFGLSRALARTWQRETRWWSRGWITTPMSLPGCWPRRDAGASMRHVGIRTDDCTLDLDELRDALSPRTRLVAVGCASNAVGTVNPVAEIVKLAHETGALVFLDAVHYAPHRLIDVEAWGCDFLACSAYKFFGPHVGLLWGRRELMESLPAYKVRPAADTIPDRWMTGTQSHEGIAGAKAAIEYLADLGRSLDPARAARARRWPRRLPALANTRHSCPRGCCQAWPSCRDSSCSGFPARRGWTNACPRCRFAMPRYRRVKWPCGWQSRVFSPGTATFMRCR